MTQQILQIQQLQKYYGAKCVLNAVDLNLNRRERAVLVGENGVGKSTLARVILGQESGDSGTIRLAPDAQIAYLPQEVQTDAHITVGEYIAARIGALNRIQQRLSELEAQMAAGGDLEAVLDEYGRLQELFEQRGGYTLQSRLEQIFAGLELQHVGQERRMLSLSGGERTRVCLGVLLLQAPDLLILDEPTNHLDFAGLAWLENYLLSYPKALLMMTHDRQFINRVATRILDLSAVTQRLQSYEGNYEDYLAQRQQRYEQEVAAYHAQTSQMKALQAQMKREAQAQRKPKRLADGDKYIKWHGGQTAERTVSKRVRSARQQLNELQANRLDNPRHTWHIQFDFDPHPLTSSEPIRLQGLCLNFGARRLIDRADAVLKKGERVALVAPNGSGKTSLLRLIMGELPPSDGDIAVMAGARLGYLDQTGEALDANRRAVDVLGEIRHASQDALLTRLHRSGLFRDAHLADKTVADLSIGQRRKLGIACLIHSRANVLLLDEPTNHLDLASLEALETALRQFKGAILAATHDRRFIDTVATQVWHLHDGQLQPQ